MVFKEDVTVITCIGLSKKPEKKFRKESNQQSEPGNERDIRETVGLWNPGHFHHHWSSLDSCSFWESSYHTCHKPTADPWLYNVNFTLPRGTDRHRYEELIHDLDLHRMEYPPLRVIHSFTDLDMTDTVMVSPWSWLSHVVMLMYLILTLHEHHIRKWFSISPKKIRKWR